ncbi:MAG: hypothetical protein WC683_07810 [bacterium]
MSVRFSFTVDDETASILRAIAKVQRRTVGNLAVVAIEEYAARKAGEQKRLQTLRKARKVSQDQEEGQDALPVHASTPQDDQAGGQA